MATVYRGYRNIIKGRNSNDAVHPTKGVGEYSNWDLLNTSHALDGAPDRHYAPGTGDYPNDYALTYEWRGLHKISPLKDPGLGPELTWADHHPFEYKGLESTQALKNPGHAYGRENDNANWTNFFFVGVPSAEPLATDDIGHAVRAESVWNSFGSFGPNVHKGVGDQVMADPGKAVPTEYDYELGFNKINEWQGVPSSKAL